MGLQFLIPSHITLEYSFGFLLWAQQVFPGELVEAVLQSFTIQVASDQGMYFCNRGSWWIREFQVALLDCSPLFLYFHIFRGFNLAPRLEQKFYSITNKYRCITSFLSKGCFAKDGLVSWWEEILQKLNIYRPLEQRWDFLYLLVKGGKPGLCRLSGCGHIKGAQCPPLSSRALGLLLKDPSGWGRTSKWANSFFHFPGLGLYSIFCLLV